jgi:hypothetical protein
MLFPRATKPMSARRGCQLAEIRLAAERGHVVIPAFRTAARSSRRQRLDDGAGQVRRDVRRNAHANITTKFDLHRRSADRWLHAGICRDHDLGKPRRDFAQITPLSINLPRDDIAAPRDPAYRQEGSVDVSFDAPARSRTGWRKWSRGIDSHHHRDGVPLALILAHQHGAVLEASHYHCRRFLALPYNEVCTCI